MTIKRTGQAEEEKPVIGEKKSLSGGG